LQCKISNIRTNKKLTMVDTETFKSMALSLPGTVDVPHFNRTAFRTKARIFATLETTRQQANLRLTLIDQSVFSAIDPAIIYPLNNKWGKQGWTCIELKKARKTILKDALSRAYKLAAPIEKQNQKQ
jgi:hypothetical protein